MSRRITATTVRDAAMPRRKRAVLYLRVSSKKQTETDYDPDGASIATQRSAGIRKAADLDAEVVDEYVEPGSSGTNVDGRKRFQAMMARIKAEQESIT